MTLEILITYLPIDCKFDYIRYFVFQRPLASNAFKLRLNKTFFLFSDSVTKIQVKTIS